MQLALFDLDNTLLAGDSDYQWGQFLIEIGVLDRAQHQTVNDQFYQDYKDGCLDIRAFLEFQLKPLASHSRAQLDLWHQQYMQQKIYPMMTEKAKKLVQQHQQNGDLCLIITATNSFVTRPIAHAFGIEHLIGTTPEEMDGNFTGRVAGTPSFKEGKVIRLNEWLAEQNKVLQDFEKSYFYSDSHNDLPLLQVVTHPVAVNPDPQLKSYAEKHGWPLMDLRN